MLAAVRRHIWEGLATGLTLGLLHAIVLATGGLYVLAGTLTTATSLARYAGLFGLIGAAIGLVVGLFLSPATRFRKLTYEQPARPAPLLMLVIYVGLWAVFLADDRIGRHAIVPTVVICACVATLLLALLFLVLGRWEPRTPAFAAPRRSLIVLLAITVVLWASPMWVPPDTLPPSGDGSTQTTGAEAASSLIEQAQRSDGKRWNLLLLTIDTLRADHLGMYGYARNTSPVLDALAETGVRFDLAFCPRPKTSPSFATIHTGTWPARHGVHGAMQRLADDNETLAEYLTSVGYRTGAVITNGNLYPVFAFDQGFASYAWGHGGEAVAGLSLDWLDANATSDEPWFLWVHYTNPHAPYAPPAPFDTLFRDAEHSELERQIALYDGEIRYTDTEIGRILRWLDDRGLRENTLIVFTADHGESLGEHQYYFAHGLHTYEPSARIPLVLSAPGAIPAARTSGALVTAADIVPTVLDALGVPTLADIQGQSILPVATGLVEDTARDFVIIEAGYNPHSETGETMALRRDTTKYVHRLRGWALQPAGPAAAFWTFNARLEGGLRPDELYDLAEDPRETHNLLVERHATSIEERRILRAFAAQLYATGRGKTKGPAELDRKTYESLKSLGYL